MKAPESGWRDVRTLAKQLATEEGRTWADLTTIELGIYYARARAELARAPSRPSI